MSDRLFISPLDCKHLGTLLLEDYRSSSPPERRLVTLCPRCGSFFVTVSREGVHFRIRFDPPTRELVEAAGRYCEYLDRGED